MNATEAHAYDIIDAYEAVQIAEAAYNRLLVQTGGPDKFALREARRILNTARANLTVAIAAGTGECNVRERLHVSDAVSAALV